MKAWAEDTNFNVRCGPQTDSPRAPYEVAVNCVVADGVHAVVKCLSAGTRFTPGHALAIRELIERKGFVPVWYRINQEDKIVMTIAKKKLPNPKDVHSDAGHLAAVKLGIEQIEAGHYKLSEISVTQIDVGPGEVILVASCRRKETNPNEPAS